MNKKTLNSFLKTWQRSINNASPGQQKREAFKSFLNRFKKLNPEPLEKINLYNIKGQYFKIEGQLIVIKQFKTGRKKGLFSFYICP